MSRTIVEQTDASVVQTSGSFATVTDASASGGSYLTTANGVLTITVPAGVNAVILACTRIGRTAVASVTVDGVAKANWAQDDFTTATATGGATYTSNGTTMPVAWYKSCYPPITFANTAITHTVVLGVVAGTVSFDFYEKYATAAFTAGKLVGFGHSIVAGSGATAASLSFGDVLATYLGMTYTRNGVSSESLHAGNTGVATAGYTRAETAGQWWDTAPELGLIMHGRNDSFFYSASDPGGGVGFCIENFKQRLRELVWKIVANSPATKIIVAGILWEDFAGGGLTAQLANRLLYDAAIQSVCGEAAIAPYAVCVPVWSVTQGVSGAALISASDHIHPTNDGHAATALALAGIGRWMRQRVGTSGVS